MPKTLHLHYFALLREQRGLAQETLMTDAITPAELYAELREKHLFTLPADRLRVAIDDDFVSWTTLLKEGARVTFIPPVAGG